MMKKKIIKKIILYILTVILTFYISACLVFFSLFNISEKFFNRDNVYEVINRIDIFSIIKDELGNELTEFDIIQDELEEIGISSSNISEFLETEDVKDFTSKTIVNVMDRIVNKADVDYKVDDAEVYGLIENNIDKLELADNVDRNVIVNKIQDKIPSLVLNVNKIIDKVCIKIEESDMFQKYQGYVFKSINILDYIYSDIVEFMIIFTILFFISLLIFIRGDVYKALKWIAMSFLIGAILIKGCNIMILLIRIDNSLINNIIKVIDNYLLSYFKLYLAFFSIFVIINIIMYFIRKYESKKKVSYAKKN